ncbi:hypothetical protein ADUPG1_005250, partial [Aduncisulcus paluster]
MNVKTKKIASNVFDWTFIHLPTFCAAVENEESEMSEKKKKGSEALYKPETLLDAWALFLSKKGEDRILDDDICRKDDAIYSAYDTLMTLTDEQKRAIEADIKRLMDLQAHDDFVMANGI